MEKDALPYVLEAFAPFISPDSRHTRPNLTRVLVRAFEFASVTGSGSASPGEGGPANFILIDRLSLFKALVSDGIERRGPNTSSSWLLDWLARHEVDPLSLLELGRQRAEDVTRAWSSGAQIQVSLSMRERVLPAAQNLAREMTGGDGMHLRHLTFALVDDAAPSWFGPGFAHDGVKQLRDDFINRGINTYPGEARVWRALAARTTDPNEEMVRTIGDGPTEQDGLGRADFAKVIADRIRNVRETLPVREKGRDSAFVLHLDGAWGSGKSSILNLLKAELASDWLIVEFNAWRHQHRKPPWWPLIDAVHKSGIGGDGHLVRLWWRMRMDWAPYLALFIGAVVIILLTTTSKGQASEERSVIDLAKPIGGGIAGVVAVFAFVTLVRQLIHGSSKNAETYLENKRDPLGPIAHHFECLIAAIGRPVAIFIDDIDRCDRNYVVDLLEGVQTLLRGARVIYIVAGDRKWISSSFEKRYADFGDTVGEPGRPLGHLFLDKVFQLSTSVPRLSAKRQADYWSALLASDKPGSTEAQLQAQRTAIESYARQAEADLKGLIRHEDIQRAIDATTDIVKQEALRAAAAKLAATPSVEHETKHRLSSLATLLEPNPRAMKRLLNAYGLNYQRALLEGRRFSVEALARWTIVELRWPLLADYLMENWPDISNGSLSPDAFPAAIKDLLLDPDIRAVINSTRYAGQLTIDNLKALLD